MEYRDIPFDMFQDYLQYTARDNPARALVVHNIIKPPQDGGVRRLMWEQFDYAQEHDFVFFNALQSELQSDLVEAPKIDTEIISTEIMITNIPHPMSRTKFVQYMNEMSLPVPMELDHFRQTGHTARIASVTLDNPEAASLWKSRLHGYVLQGQRLRLEYSKLPQQALDSNTECTAPQLRGPLKEPRPRPNTGPLIWLYSVPDSPPPSGLWSRQELGSTEDWSPSPYVEPSQYQYSRSDSPAETRPFRFSALALPFRPIRHDILSPPSSGSTPSSWQEWSQTETESPQSSGAFEEKQHRRNK